MMTHCFTKLPNEVSIPIDAAAHDFQFTRNWFRSRNQSTWSTFLPPRFGGQPINMLQIGVFEGMDLVWCLQNISTHPQSRVVAIDPWLPTTKLDAEFMVGVHRRAVHNLAPWNDRVLLLRGLSQEILAGRNHEWRRCWLDNWFDLIVIDGDHNAEPVYTDAVNSYTLCKPGGWMVFDDVENRIPKKDHVKQGIERWLLEYSERVRLVWKHRFAECYEKILEK